MGTGTSSTPQSGLSSLFLGNQPTQTGQSGALAPITAPQSLIGEGTVTPPKPTSPVASPQPTYGWIMVKDPTKDTTGFNNEGEGGVPRVGYSRVWGPIPARSEEATLGK